MYAWLLAHTIVCYHIQHNIYLKVVFITVDEHAYTRRNTSLYHVTDYVRMIWTTVNWLH